MPDPEKSKNIILSMGPQEHPEQCGATRSSIRASKVPFLAKITKMPLVSQWFDRRLNDVQNLTKQHFSQFYIKLELLKEF